MTDLALHARVSQAVAEVVAERGQNACGRILGHAGTTIWRWGSDLHDWPAADLLTMAKHEAAIADAITDLLEQRQESQEEVEAQVRHVVRDCGEEIAELMTRMEDGRVDQSEARENLSGVRHLIADLRKLERGLMDRARGARL